MRRPKLAFWCWIFLLVASSESRENSTTTSDDERNNFTVRYEIHANVTMTNRSNMEELVRYNIRENSTKNDDDMQYEFRANSTTDDHEDNDSVQYELHVHSTKDRKGDIQRLAELRTNFTKVYNHSTNSHELHMNLMQAKDKSNLTLYELRENEDDVKEKVLPYEMCENSTCILLCCSLGSRLIKVGNEETCSTEKANYFFPEAYEFVPGPVNDSLVKVPIGKKLDQLFQLSVHDPCGLFQRYLLEPDNNQYDEYTVLDNGTLYLPRVDDFIDSYCLALVEDRYEIAACFDSVDEVLLEEQNGGIPVGLIVSLPFFLATYVIYSILPELRNMHGYTLRGYVGSLFVAYTFLAILQLVPQDVLSEFTCIAWGTAYNNTVNAAYTSVRLINILFAC